MPHLMHINGKHQSERQRPAEKARIESEKERHRREGAQLRKPKKEQLSLGEQQHDHELELDEEHGDRADHGAVLSVFRPHTVDFCSTSVGGRPVAESGDPIVDRGVLLRIARKPVEGLPPERDCALRVALCFRLASVGGELLQLVSVDEGSTGGTNEKRRSQFRRAMPTRTLAWRDVRERRLSQSFQRLWRRRRRGTGPRYSAPRVD